MTAYRYSDNQKQIGPFILSNDYSNYGIKLSSDFYGDFVTALIFSISKWSLLIMLPNFMKPMKEYGFMYWPEGNSFSLLYGRQADMNENRDDSKKIMWQFPFKEWRHIRKTTYNPDSTVFLDEIRAERKQGGIDEFTRVYELLRQCPVEKFLFSDFDGEVIEVSCKKEQWEWRRGTGWFEWLSLFSKPKVRTSLDLSFSAEVGRKKGSWKGGVIGTSIDMPDFNESYENAFRRYCKIKNLQFVKKLNDE